MRHQRVGFGVDDHFIFDFTCAQSVRRIFDADGKAVKAGRDNPFVAGINDHGTDFGGWVF